MRNMAFPSVVPARRTFLAPDNGKGRPSGLGETAFFGFGLRPLTAGVDYCGCLPM